MSEDYEYNKAIRKIGELTLKMEDTLENNDKYFKWYKDEVNKVSNLRKEIDILNGKCDVAEEIADKYFKAIDELVQSKKEMTASHIIKRLKSLNPIVWEA